MLKAIIENKKNKKAFVLLIDPDKFSSARFVTILQKMEKALPDAIFVGGSLLFNDIEKTIIDIKQKTNIPVYIFPGGAMQISDKADGILFTMLISGRNSEFLIGNQVTVAPFIKKHKLQTMSVGYMLVGETNQTAVKYMSNTMPIPYAKSDIAVATALAGNMLGLQSIYLEAGSGAETPVSNDMITKVKQNINIPLIVGGGIKSSQQLEQIYSAGADIVVMGTAFEQSEIDFDNIKKVIQNYCK